MSPVPSDEKIVFTRRTLKHTQCIKVDWSDSDTSTAWTSLFYWLGSAEIWDSIITKISYSCIPEGSFVYTKLVPFDSAESRKMREDPLVTASTSTNGRRGGAKFGMHAIFARGYDVQLSRERIPEIYQKYSSWMYDHQPFIVSRDPLPDWEATLHPGRFFGWRIRKELLERIFLVLFNHYEHGFEIIGRSVRPDSLLGVAQGVSRDYNLPLQVQESGNPFGHP